MNNHVTIHQIATGDVYLNVMQQSGEYVGVWTMASEHVPHIVALCESVSNKSIVAFMVFQNEESLQRFIEDSAWIVRQRFPQFKALRTSAGRGDNNVTKDSQAS